MTCYAYDDVDRWRCQYPRDVYEAQLVKLVSKWKEGLELLKDSDGGEFKTMAEAGYSIFRASLNLTQFIRLRDNGGSNGELRAIVLDERENAVNMLALMNKNPAIGFEAANHYYFSRFGLMEKIVNCDHLLEKYKIQ